MSRADGVLSKERPILFSAPMVRAILDGKKTQTRRVVKPQPYDVQALNDGSWESSPDGGFDVGVKTLKCPYGQSGERLWVREAWCAADTAYQTHEIDPPGVIGYPADKSAIKYDAKVPTPVPLWDVEQWSWEKLRKRPSIHMPRWASRIDLEVTGVRVQRLQDISEQDAWAEGCEGFDDDVTGGQSGYSEYAGLWDQINGPGSWDANPWVWVIKFRRVKP